EGIQSLRCFSKRVFSICFPCGSTGTPAQGPIERRKREEGRVRRTSCPARSISRFQRLRPISQSLRYDSRMTSFSALSRGTCSVFPSGNFISKIAERSPWSWYWVSSGRPFMPLAKLAAELDEISEPKRSSELEHQ